MITRQEYHQRKKEDSKEELVESTDTIQVETVQIEESVEETTPSVDKVNRFLNWAIGITAVLLIIVLTIAFLSKILFEDFVFITAMRV